MRAVIFTILTIFTPYFAVAGDIECDCGEFPYVAYELSDEVELDENVWRVESIAVTADMTRIDEPSICTVELALFADDDPLLYVDIQDVPDGDFEVYYIGRWMLATEFEKLMEATQCMSSGEQS